MSKCQNVNYFLAHDVYVCIRVCVRIRMYNFSKRLTFLTF